MVGWGQVEAGCPPLRAGVNLSGPSGLTVLYLAMNVAASCLSPSGCHFFQLSSLLVFLLCLRMA